MTRSRIEVVLLGGLIVGTIDITFALLFWSVGHDAPPSRVLQSIAAGLLGQSSFEGGTATAVLGLGLHYTIATGMGLAYFLVARHWRALVTHPVPLGLAYGLLLYAIMSFVVLPLSAVGMPKFANPVWVSSSIAMHALFGAIFAQFARAAIMPGAAHASSHLPRM